MAMENPKEDINREGWEEDVAVIIGSKEELPQLLEHLEKEGKAKDLGTYILMHKEVLLSQEDPEMGDHVIRGAIAKAKGLVWEDITVHATSRVKNERKTYYVGGLINFVDKDGNLARVRVDSQKISDYKNWQWIEAIGGKGHYESLLKEDLKRLGFNVVASPYEELEKFGLQQQDLRIAIDRKTQRLEREAQEKKKKEFDF